jgi:hypothetical protein
MPGTWLFWWRRNSVMEKVEPFKVWAPERSVWSRWVKPTFFLQMRQSFRYAAAADSPGGQAGSSPAWLSGLSRQTAVILDLPGVEGVQAGIDCARNGYRPIPLYNAWAHLHRVLDLQPLHDALASSTGELDRIQIPDDAPPVFLLNADRISGIPVPGRFDNRWILFPQDLPSARFLLSHGITQVLLVKSYDHMKQDLLHVLRRYQDEKMALRVARPGDARPAVLTIPRPTWYRSVFYRLAASRPYRRSNAGGFGGMVPEPSSGGGFG